MKKILWFVFLSAILASEANAQTEKISVPKPWFITSEKEYRLTTPASYQAEIDIVLSAQQNLSESDKLEMAYWNAGAPGYRWREMLSKIWVVDTGYYGALANMLLNTATYDATLSAWDTKFAHKRPRPYEADYRIKALLLKPGFPSYPCEHSVAAGVAVTIIGNFYPHLTDSVNKMAKREMALRVAAGMAFPSDTRDGYELGKRIAQKAIEQTKDHVNKARWDGKHPEGDEKWKGQWAMLPMAGTNKTMVLTSGSQFRPAPPNDFDKQMAELKNYKQTFRSRSNAFFWANQDFWTDCLNKEIFEHNLHLDPPRAAALYSVAAVAIYDGFIACWDAKYAYWGIRPEQYDTSFKPLMSAPPFPGYPSGHAAISGVMSELLSYYFPEDKAYFLQKAKDAADSRFQAGIHFRSDNEVGVDLGRKVAAAVIDKMGREKSGVSKK